MLDIGTDTTRAGYAGDDAPKAVFSTSYGFTVHPPAEGETGDDKSMPTKLYIGENGPSIWRPRMEVSNPFTNGLSASSPRRPAVLFSRCTQSATSRPSLLSYRTLLFTHCVPPLPNTQSWSRNPLGTPQPTESEWPRSSSRSSKFQRSTLPTQVF